MADATPDAITVALFIVGAIGWCIAMGAAIALVRKRRGDISLLRLWFDGMSWFRRDTFRPEGDRLWRVFVAGWLLCAAAFAGVVLRSLLVA